MNMEQMEYFYLALIESDANEHSEEHLDAENAGKLRQAQRALYRYLEEIVREENKNG